jgi:hypothetical protein
MGNDDRSFEDEVARGEYSREITKLLKDNSLNWYSSPSIKKPEIFIRPEGNYEWDNTSSKVSRISLQIKDNSISFGVSGYFPVRILNDYPIYKDRKYVYHDRDGNTSPQEAVDKQREEGSKGPKGRWWLTKSLGNLGDIVGEFKNIEHTFLTNDSYEC